MTATFSNLGARVTLLAALGSDLAIPVTVTVNGVAFPWAGVTVTTQIVNINNASTPAAVATLTFTPGVSGAATVSLTKAQLDTLGDGSTYLYSIVANVGNVLQWSLGGQLSVKAAFRPNQSATAGIAVTVTADTIAVTLTTAVSPSILAADVAFTGRYVALNAEAVTTQQAYSVSVVTKNDHAALKLVASTTATANKAPLQVYGPKSSPNGEDVLQSWDFAGNGFPGPITSITANGGINTGAWLVVSGHSKNSGSSSLFSEASYLRTMVSVWSDTPGASAAESNCVLAVRNVGAAWPSGDGGNCNMLLVVEDAATDVQADGKERLSIRPKGDIYQHFTTHITDAFAATNYERSHYGWDVANSRLVLETQAGGTGVRRELLVKDRKHFVIAAIGTFAATTTLGWWTAPRDCKITAGKFVNETGFGVSGSNFWRAAVTYYPAGTYSSDILNRGNDAAIIGTSTSFDLGTPAATTVSAGQVLRIFINKAVGAPANLVNPTFTIEWEPV